MIFVTRASSVELFTPYSGTS